MQLNSRDALYTISLLTLFQSIAASNCQNDPKFSQEMKVLTTLFMGIQGHMGLCPLSAGGHASTQDA